MNLVIPKYLIDEAINCIANATHTVPYLRVNNLILRLQSLAPQEDLQPAVKEAPVEDHA